ncbi:hypothetical protein [Streptomyces osmaniensis]|uniref:Uncharacterized protein n=1 Tax=Streptomyces osmaniensis TaxID=593134 RepID=A0ABP6YVL3_9ACTN
MLTVIAVTTAVALPAGYLLRDQNAFPRLLSWAEDATSPGWRTWKFWPAAPVIIVALAWMWTVHPRRTLANVRSWRQPPPPRGPALTFDPDWAAKRSARIPDHTVDEEG